MRVHVTRGLLSGVIALLFFWGLARVPLAQGTALAFVAPVAALFLAVVILGERIPRRAIIASMLAFMGVLTILAGQLYVDSSSRVVIGSLAVLASALFYGWNIILMRQQAQIAKPAEVAFFQTLIMTSVIMLGAPVFAVVPEMKHLPMIAGGAFLATASLLLLSWAYARAEASYLATVEYTSFVWSAVLGYLFFAETLSLYTIAGAAIIVAGCVLAAQRNPEPFAEIEGVH